MPVRRVPGLVALVALVLALAGCRLDVAVETSVARDGSGVVRVAVAADPDLVARAPLALADLRLDDLRAAGWAVTGPTVESDGRTVVRLEKPFATLDEGAAILRSLNGAGGPLHDVSLTTTTDGDDQTVTFSGTARLDGGVEVFADSALVQVAGGVPFAGDLAAAQVPLEQAVGFTFSVALPGEVTAPGAGVDDGTATWTAPLGPGQATVLSARGEWTETGPDRYRAIARVALAALAVYLVAVTAIVVARRRRATARR